jgi:hypothetical protein
VTEKDWIENKVSKGKGQVSVGREREVELVRKKMFEKVNGQLL